jgi:hypothetical protein
MGWGVPRSLVVLVPRPFGPLFSVSLCFADDMAELLLGEAKLEQHLKGHPLRQGASPRGPRPQLTEVRKHLTAALDRGNLKVLWASVTKRGLWGMLALSPWMIQSWERCPGTNHAMFGVLLHTAGTCHQQAVP